jgi:hypothetical protein
MSKTYLECTPVEQQEVERLFDEIEKRFQLKEDLGKTLTDDRERIATAQEQLIQWTIEINVRLSRLEALGIDVDPAQLAKFVIEMAAVLEARIH